jgi:hypothetical protein
MPPFLRPIHKAKQSQVEPKMGDTQQSFRMIGEVRAPHHADPDVIAQLPTFRAALRHAINHSGFDQEVIAEALGIDPACFSRMVREPRNVAARPRELPHEKLAGFCMVTGSLAPIQWQDAQLGLEPVSMRETRIQRLERQLAAERERTQQVAA